MERLYRREVFTIALPFEIDFGLFMEEYNRRFCRAENIPGQYIEDITEEYNKSNKNKKCVLQLVAPDKENIDKMLGNIAILEEEIMRIKETLRIAAIAK